MKKLYTSIFVLLGLIWLASPVTFAQSNTYIKTPNAAISGHNNKYLPNVTPQQCQTACSQERSFSCKSFDYDKENYACDLSDKRASDVGGLKRDYAGDQYDHYSLSPRFTSNPRPTITTPPPTGPSIIPDSSIAHTGKLACVCTENSCDSGIVSGKAGDIFCLLYTSPSPRDRG